MEECIIYALELLDAEVVVVDKTLGGVFAILHCSHFDAAPHAVEGHGNHGIARLPADGAVFGVILHRPNAGLGFDEGLVAVCVVLGDEVVDGGVLVEVVGRVGLAFGGGTVSDVIVIVGGVVGRGCFLTKRRHKRLPPKHYISRNRIRCVIFINFVIKRVISINLHRSEGADNNSCLTYCIVLTRMNHKFEERDWACKISVPGTREASRNLA